MKTFTMVDNPRSQFTARVTVETYTPNCTIVRIRPLAEDSQSRPHLALDRKQVFKLAIALLKAAEEMTS